MDRAVTAMAGNTLGNFNEECTADRHFRAFLVGLFTPREPEGGFLRTDAGRAADERLLFLVHLGRRLMRLLWTNLMAAALLGAGLMTTAGRAATFSGGSADITDFAGGSEVSRPAFAPRKRAVRHLADERSHEPVLPAFRRPGIVVD